LHRAARKLKPSEPAAHQADRNRLKNTVRYRAVTIDRVWTTAVSKHLGIESKSHLISLDNGLSATAVWFKPIGTPSNAPATVILNDKGKAASAGSIVDSSGMRSQVVSFIASALHPEMFSELVIRGGIESLAYLLQKPVKYGDAPELFCLDLLRVTDLDRLAALSSPIRIIRLDVP